MFVGDRNVISGCVSDCDESQGVDRELEHPDGHLAAASVLRPHQGAAHGPDLRAECPVARLLPRVLPGLHGSCLLHPRLTGCK